MRCRAERGQTSAEYMGLLLVVATIIGALLLSGLPGAIAGFVRDQVCAIAGDCAPPSAGEGGEKEGPRTQAADPSRQAAQRRPTATRTAERRAPATSRLG